MSISYLANDFSKFNLPVFIIAAQTYNNNSNKLSLKKKTISYFFHLLFKMYKLHVWDCYCIRNIDDYF